MFVNWSGRNQVDLKKIFSETAFRNEPKFSRKHLQKVLYKECAFRSDSLTIMAVAGNGKVVSEEKIFLLNRPIRNKNYLGWPCLLIDRDEISNHYRGSSIDAFYQVLLIKKSSPLKPLYQMNHNLVGSIYGRSSINIAHFVWITCDSHNC
jgi:hypothetical protein